MGEENQKKDADYYNSSRIDPGHNKKEPMELLDDRIRYEIVDRHPDVKGLFKEHGKLFAFLTASSTTKEMADPIWYMVHIRECQEQGLIR